MLLILHHEKKVDQVVQDGVVRDGSVWVHGKKISELNGEYAYVPNQPLKLNNNGVDMSFPDDFIVCNEPNLDELWAAILDLQERVAKLEEN